MRVRVEEVRVPPVEVGCCCYLRASAQHLLSGCGDGSQAKDGTEGAGRRGGAGSAADGVQMMTM